MEEKRKKKPYRCPHVEKMKITCEDILISSDEEGKDENQGPWDPQQELNIWNKW